MPILQLRRIGIDPFSRTAMLEMVPAGEDARQWRGPVRHRTPGAPLPACPATRHSCPHARTPVAAALDRTAGRGEPGRRNPAHADRDRPSAADAALLLLAARMLAFVLLPTLPCRLVFLPRRHADVCHQGRVRDPAGRTGQFGRRSLAGSSRAPALPPRRIRSRSRPTCNRARRCCGWNQTLGFREHFQSETIDPVQRLAPDASLEDAYDVYKRVCEDLLRHLRRPDPDGGGCGRPEGRRAMGRPAGRLCRGTGRPPDPALAGRPDDGRAGRL